MRISEFEWNDGNILHLALHHGIEPEEAEEVFAVTPIFRKTKRGHFTAFGPTRSGRLLVVVFEYQGRGRVRVITGWDMNAAERRYYQRQRREEAMKRRALKVAESPAEYYDRRGVLAELTRRPVEFALDEELRRQILRGQRSRRLQNLSIKLDAAQIQALRKIATMRAIPYQTLIRQWLADGIRKELHLSRA